MNSFPFQDEKTVTDAERNSNSSESVNTKSHQRKLLSLELPEVEAIISDLNNQGDFTVNLNKAAALQDGFDNNLDTTAISVDDLILADWIANTKQKQLSLKRDQLESLEKWNSRYGDWQPQQQPSATSFLPWERLGTFQQLQKSLERWKRSQEFASYQLPSRKLMDTFADSLLHVHRIYNRKFGYMGRKVPAHMPHMIDKKVMEELQDMLPEEFDKTSSHKLRSPDDMQFAFSYYYFVVGQKKTPNVSEFFAEVDADHSGLTRNFRRQFYFMN